MESQPVCHDTPYDRLRYRPQVVQSYTHYRAKMNFLTFNFDGGKKKILDRNLYSAMRDDTMKKRRLFFCMSCDTIILVIASLRIVSDNVCGHAFAYI